MLLDIEGRIGELALKEPQILKNQYSKVPLKGSPHSSKPKHERLGFPSLERMSQSEAISKHPAIVERIKAQARENADSAIEGGIGNTIRQYRLRNCNPSLIRLAGAIVTHLPFNKGNGLSFNKGLSLVYFTKIFEQAE